MCGSQVILNAFFHFFLIGELLRGSCPAHVDSRDYSSTAASDDDCSMFTKDVLLLGIILEDGKASCPLRPPSRDGYCTRG